MSEFSVAAATSYRVAETAADRSAVLRLREAVYVLDQGRLAHAADTADTFDRFDGQAVYLLAEDGSGPVGTVKLIADSPLGLPCGQYADLGPLRPGRRLVEFGHLMTLPRARGRAIGLGLMRAALVHSVSRLGATHVLGDFFADADGGLLPFYTGLGFVVVGSPYRDPRFLEAPLSVVAVLDLDAAAGRVAGADGPAGEALRYFFHDYELLRGLR